MSAVIQTPEFLVAATYEKDGQDVIDDCLRLGWKVAGITSASNSGGVWVMLVRHTDDEGSPE